MTVARSRARRVVTSRPGARACALALLATVLGVACGSARRGEPFIGPPGPPDAQLALGRREFDRTCSQCHPGGEAGIGPALNDKPLPRLAMRIQVRNGFGAMPRITSAELGDRELDAVTRYLTWLRGRKARP